MKELISGYRKFYSEYFLSGSSVYKNLSQHGQSPKALVIACSDSRADPSIIMKAQPGDIFVIRNVANIVPPYQPGDGLLHGVSAAIEFAVKFLEVENIIVLGHSNCAGVNALLNPNDIPQTDFIGAWMDVAKPARVAVLSGEIPFEDGEINKCCEQEVVILSLSNLLQFPWIMQRVEQGKLKLHGWHFNISSGELQQYDPQEDEFIEV